MGPQRSGPAENKFPQIHSIFADSKNNNCYPITTISSKTRRPRTLDPMHMATTVAESLCKMKC